METIFNMDTIIIFSINIVFIILSIIFYYLLTNRGIFSNTKKILVIIDVVFLIINMLVLFGLSMFLLYGHFFVG